MAWHCAGTGGIHQSIRQLRRDPWPRSLPVAIAGRAFRGRVEATSKSRVGEPSANGHGCRNFECVPCVALWQQLGGGRYRIRGTDQSLLATSDSATNYFLGALGSRRCRKRTPGPPPFSSMNSTPPTSKARRTAKSFAVVIDVLSSASSARLIVASPNAASRASSAALHRRRARAARIWPLFNGFGFMVDQAGIV
jgi:hypothetical protein